MIEEIDNIVSLEKFCHENVLNIEEKRIIYNKYYNWFKNDIYNTKELVISFARITKIINCTIDDILSKNYIPRSLIDCLYEEALDINPNYVDFFYTKFLKLDTNFYELLFRYNYKIRTLTSPLNNDINLFKTYIKNGSNINIINLYTGKNIDDNELLNLLFSNKYLINEKSPKGIKNSTYALYKALNYNYDISIVNYYDDYVDLSEDFINYIFKHGYKISSNSCKKVLSNTYTFICAINNGEDINIINLYTYDSYGNNTYLDALKKIIFNSNYIISNATPKALLNDKNEIQNYIINNINSINPYIIDYIDIELNKYVIKILFDKGYKINIDTKLYIIEDSEFMKNIYDRKYPNTCNNILKELNYNYGYLIYFLENIDFDDSLLKYIDNDINTLYIVKYIFYGDKSLRDKLINIINNNQYIVFNNVYNYLFESFDIDIFINMLNNYKKNFNIFNEILLNKELINSNREMKILLIKKLVYDNNNIHINRISDLKKYKETIFNSNNDIINLNNIIYTKNVIFNCLFNLDYNKVSYILKYIINSEKIIDLINSTNYLESILIEYKYFIEIIEYIYLEDDIDKLNTLARNINNSNYLYIWNVFKNIEKDIKCFYGKEIDEKIVNYNELLNIKYFDIPKINNEESYIIDEYEGIKYIKLNGIPFVTFLHEMNKYNNTSKLSDFKYNKFIGKSYFCLSSIGDNYCVIDKKRCNSIDDLILLFDTLPYDKLYLESNDDIMTRGNYNDINISSLPPNFNSVRTNITLSKYGNYNYSEYVYYRDNLKVSAILVLGDEPSKYEVEGAKYLNVPLVKINKEKYPYLKYEQRVKKDIRLKDYYQNLLRFRNIRQDNSILVNLRNVREMIATYFNVNKKYKQKIY